MAHMANISKNSKLSNYVKDETIEPIEPIKNKRDRKAFKRLWLSSSSRSGRKNWTIFCLGIITALRASDLVKLKTWQVYYSNGQPRHHIIYEIDKKTHKRNRYLNIDSAKKCLIIYRKWRIHKGLRTQWLFPRETDHYHHVSSDYIYRMLSRAGDKLGIYHIGSSSLRKTFGYLAYKQTHNIVFVMKRLNHSNPKVTLRYIGIDQEIMDSISESLKFDL